MDHKNVREATTDPSSCKTLLAADKKAAVGGKYGHNYRRSWRDLGLTADLSVSVRSLGKATWVLST